ncbi:DEKNAAC104453 [Brettanomyces naardenensis]|uniref:Pre-mRNA-splicing factor 38 n=1 Tax=Brettanomyces naardenensis TaxID=13370 RepID=A0A448YRG6_BRENA|nr:DEKNAAC104453 [Brettanomyces naardenensis]
MSESTTRKQDPGIIVDRGLAYGVERVHGVNPVLLIEKILRERIMDSLYWQKDCVPLNLLSLIDEIVLHLRLLGTYSNVAKTRPTRFICLTLKLLSLQPSTEIIDYLLVQRDFKYLSAFAALYIRVTRSSVEVYERLEPLLKDGRKLNFYEGGAAFVTHIDEFIDGLLNKEKFCDLMLPRLIDREQLEDRELLEPRESEIQSEFEEEVEREEEGLKD